MTHVGPPHRYTYADYVALEQSSPTKHEFLDGEIYAMAGGSEEHSALNAEVLRLLGNAVGERPCRVPLQQHPPSPKATALNPSVLLEVTSDSSEHYDQNTKLESYRAIDSLRDYVIVSRRERRITVHSRDADGNWITRVAVSAGAVQVRSLAARGKSLPSPTPRGKRICVVDSALAPRRRGLSS